MLIGLQLNADTVQVALKKVLGGCVHHLCLDFGCVWGPANQELQL